MAQGKKRTRKAERYILALKMKSPFKTGTAVVGIPEYTVHQGSSPGLHILTDIWAPTLSGDAWSASHARVTGRPWGKSRARREERTGSLAL